MGNKPSLAAAVEAARKGGTVFGYLAKGARFKFWNDRTVYEKRGPTTYVEAGVTLCATQQDSTR